MLTGIASKRIGRSLVSVLQYHVNGDEIRPNCQASCLLCEGSMRSLQYFYFF